MKTASNRTEESPISGAEPSMVKSPASRPCLLVIFRPKLTLAKSPVWPLKSFVLDDKQYHDAALGEWTGFYDWLRDASGDLLGVRYGLNEETEFLGEQTRALDYVKVVAPGYIEIYFSDRRHFEPKLSADQDFLYDPIFRSDDGEYALGFAMEDLSESELRSIENAQADWGTFRPLG